MYFKLLILVFISAPFLIDCSGGITKEELQDPKSSIIFGYIDMRNTTSGELNSVHIRRYPLNPIRWLGCGVDKGLFWHSSIIDGAYKVQKFTSYGFIPRALSFGTTVYQFSASGGNTTAIKVNKPGIYFMGAYKYVNLKKDKKNRGDYDIIKIAKPSKKDLLVRLKALFIKKDKDKYSRQINMINEALK